MICGAGSVISLPRSRIQQQARAFGNFGKEFEPQATSAGMPIADARMATWEVGPPLASAIPQAVSHPGATNSDGRQIIRQQYGVFGKAMSGWAGTSPKAIKDLTFQIHQIGGAFGKAGLFQSLQHRDLGLDRGLPGMASTFPRRCCPPPARQFGVIEKRQMRRQDRGAILAHRVVELGSDRGDGIGKTRTFICGTPPFLHDRDSGTAKRRRIPRSWPGEQQRLEVEVEEELVP